MVLEMVKNAWHYRGYISMLERKATRLLKVFNNQPIYIKYFANYDIEEVEYTTYTWQVTDTTLTINETKYKLGDIIELECSADEKVRVEMIYNCDDLQDAFAIAKFRLTEDVLSALDFVQLMYGKTVELQKEEIRKNVERKIADKHSNLTVEQVLSHLYINTIGSDKLRKKVKNEVMNEMIKNIDKVILKLERGIF